MKKFLKDILGITELESRLAKFAKKEKVSTWVEVNGVAYGVAPQSLAFLIYLIDKDQESLSIEYDNALLCYEGIVLATTYGYSENCYKNPKRVFKTENVK